MEVITSVYAINFLKVQQFAIAGKKIVFTLRHQDRRKTTDRRRVLALLVQIHSQRLLPVSELHREYFFQQSVKAVSSGIKSHYSCAQKSLFC